MEIVFLSAEVPLTKTYRQRRDRIEKTSYPLVDCFTSHTEQVDTISDFFTAIGKHAALGHCLLKGTITAALVDESRAGATDRNGHTEWVCLDVDGVDIESPDDFMNALGLGNLSYIVQYSSSHGISDDLLHCHIFVMLEKPFSAPLLKQWLIDVNFNVPLLNAQFSLSPSQNFLSWPLDITTCQNDKLLYIAPPILVGIEDPLGPDRFQLVRKKSDRLRLPANISSVSANRQRIDEKINELRLGLQLPKRKASKYSNAGPIEYQTNPDQCTVTGIKQDRGYVYLNLNGGDSWGYYHPEDRFDFIYNFKGEPTYRTKDLIPDYWNDCAKEVERQEDAGVITTHFAFRDFNSAKYYNGYYDPQNREVYIAQAASEKQLNDYMSANGRVMPPAVPIWCMEFLPNEPFVIRKCPDKRGWSAQLNTFTPSIYLQQEPKKTAKIPPIIERVIRHALGGSDMVFDAFINWLAVAVQDRKAIGTAWLLSGIPGTGKGLLCHKILKPMMGHNYVVQRRMDELDDKFNDYLEECLFFFVDEVELPEMKNSNVIEAKIKNLITEETISLRGMHRASRTVPNHVNWILSSNMSDPLTITNSDRRFNVADYQPQKLKITEAEIAQIEKELQSFCDYLRVFKANRDKAREVILTAQRERLIHISTTTIDLAAQAVLTGNLQYFFDELPTGNVKYINPRQQMKLGLYKEVLGDILREPNVGAIGRDALHVLFDYLIPESPTSGNKFTSMLKHHGLHVSPCRVAGSAGIVRGVPTQWVINDRMYETLELDKSGIPLSKAIGKKQV
jgi:hypothetical protein